MEWLSIASDWGPESLLAVVVLLLLVGKLHTDKTVERIRVEKDTQYTEMKTEIKRHYESQFFEMKDHYVKRIEDLKEVHAAVTGDLRHTADTNSRALGVSVDNVRKLVAQQDELLDLSRTATPALLAQRAALESANDRGE